MGNLVPEADQEGFIEWVEEEYTDDRWCDVYKHGQSVVIWSGKHPANPRFVKDIRPRLHEHGMVMHDVRTEVPATINGGTEKVMWIKGAPIGMAVAAAHDMQCQRTVCRQVIADADSDYCPSCKPHMS